MGIVILYRYYDRYRQVRPKVGCAVRCFVHTRTTQDPAAKQTNRVGIRRFFFFGCISRGGLPDRCIIEFTQTP